jgi:hypothetical protein
MRIANHPCLYGSVLRSPKQPQPIPSASDCCLLKIMPGEKIYVTPHRPLVSLRAIDGNCARPSARCRHQHSRTRRVRRITSRICVHIQLCKWADWPNCSFFCGARRSTQFGAESPVTKSRVGLDSERPVRLHNGYQLQSTRSRLSLRAR